MGESGIDRWEFAVEISCWRRDLVLRNLPDVVSLVHEEPGEAAGVLTLYLACTRGERQASTIHTLLSLLKNSAENYYLVEKAPVLAQATNYHTAYMGGRYANLTTMPAHARLDGVYAFPTRESGIDPEGLDRERRLGDLVRAFHMWCADEEQRGERLKAS